MFWNQEFLKYSADSIADTISACQYQKNKIWSNAIIKSKNKQDDAWIITIEIPPDVNGSITGIRLLYSNEKIAGEKTENITKKFGNSMIIKIKIKLQEG